MPSTEIVGFETPMCTGEDAHVTASPATSPSRPALVSLAPSDACVVPELDFLKLSVEVPSESTSTATSSTPPTPVGRRRPVYDSVILKTKESSDPAILEQVQALSIATFGEGSVAMLTKKDWRITAMVETDSRLVLGYVLYGRDKHPGQPANVNILKLAVLPEMRKMGLGRKLTKTVVSFAKGQKISLVNLWAYPHAVKFYNILGFQTLQTSDPNGVTQTYMELRIKQKNGGHNGGKRRKK